jgi:serine protease AprX
VTDEPDLGDVAPPPPPPPEVSWQARVLCAVQALEAIDQPATPTRLNEMVGAKFASAFLPGDRLYEGARPSWEKRVGEATAALVTRKLLRRPKGRAGTASAGQQVVATTAAGRKQAEAACNLGELVAEDTTPTTDRAAPMSAVVLPGVVTAPLRDRLPPTRDHTSSVDLVGPSFRTRSGVRTVGNVIADALEQAKPDQPEPVMIELNLQYGVGPQPAQATGVAGAIARVRELWKLVGGAGEPVVVAEQYMSGDLTNQQVQNIATADSAGGDWPKRAIFRIWPDFEVHRQIDASCTTVKAVAAQRSFAAYGEGIVWAVIDSGIDQKHPHFLGDHTLDDPSVADLHHDFVSDSPDPALALIDDDGHGTHVAGIIAGGLQRWNVKDENRHAIAAEKRKNNGAVGGADPIIAPPGLRLPRRLVRVRPEPTLFGGEPTGALRRRRRRGRQLRVRQAQSERIGCDRVQRRRHDQRSRQRRTGHHRRLDAPRLATHQRDLLLLVPRPDR